MVTTAQSIVDKLESGRSVFLTGGAGVGKTWTTRAILDNYRGQVIQCGTTGVSALNLPNGMTLHSIFGLPVLEYPTLSLWASQSTRMLAQSHQYPSLLQSIEMIREASLLIVDEISMCSAWLLEILDVRLRIWRRNYLPMGGITVLFVGDFLQLPPVYAHNHLNLGVSKPPPIRTKWYAFESPVWYALGLETVELTEIKRQTEGDFMNVIGKLRWGSPLTLTERKSIMSRSSDQPPECAIEIMIQRTLVFQRNRTALAALKAPDVRYKFPYTTRTSQVRLQKQLIQDVEQTLYLQRGEKAQIFRLGTHVMLIVNSKCHDVSYVNGDRGIIVGFSDSMLNQYTLEEFHPAQAMSANAGFPVVEFERTGQRVLVRPHTFSRKIQSKGIVTSFAEVSAVPLCLAWATTVHKCQGSTISGTLHINCKMMNFIPASFYVAISRVTDLANLTLSNFSSEGQPHKKAVAFYRGQVPLPSTQLLVEILTCVEESDNTSGKRHIRQLELEDDLYQQQHVRSKKPIP